MKQLNAITMIMIVKKNMPIKSSICFLCHFGYITIMVKYNYVLLSILQLIFFNRVVGSRTYSILCFTFNSVLQNVTWIFFWDVTSHFNEMHVTEIKLLFSVILGYKITTSLICIKQLYFFSSLKLKIILHYVL